MSRIPFPGHELRKKRMDLGLTEQDVYDTLRIPKNMVEALESGQRRELPSTTYALGFLKTYCDFLGLDPERYADALRESGRQVTTLPGVPGGQDAGLRPHWMSEVMAWVAITAILALGWLAYSVTVKPASDPGDQRVQADTFFSETDR